MADEKNYGRVAIIPRGDFAGDVQYDVGDVVSYEGSSYLAKSKPPVATLPTDTNYWQVSANGIGAIATTETAGLVKPDGTRITVAEDGTISTSDIVPMTAVSAGSTEEEINAFYDNYSAEMADNTHYKAVAVHAYVHSILKGGSCYLEGHKYGNGYEHQDITSYGFSTSEKTRKFTRQRCAGNWSPWKSVDIGNVLTASKSVYVSPDGDDTTGDGTQANPWKTIQKAVDECPANSANDARYNVYIADGEYDECVLIYNKDVYIALRGSSVEDGVIIKQCLQVGRVLTFAMTGYLTLGDTSISQKHVLNIFSSYIYIATTKLKLIGNGSDTSGITCTENCSVNISSNSGLTITNCKKGIDCYNDATMNIMCAVIDNTAQYGMLASNGAKISILKANITNNATIPYYTSNGGRILTDSQGWQTIGSVTGANPVAIDSDKYTEFKVKVTFGDKGSETQIISNKDMPITLVFGAYNSSNNYTYASVGINTTRALLNNSYSGSTDYLSSTTMTVEGRRA